MHRWQITARISNAEALIAQAHKRTSMCYRCIRAWDTSWETYMLCPMCELDRAVIVERRFELEELQAQEVALIMRHSGDTK